MYELPTTVTINNKIHPIRNKGDYRVILDCFSALDDIELSKDERILSSLIIFYEELDDIEDISEIFPDLESAYGEMALFFNCGREQEDESKHNYKLIDWDKDSLLICSAINKVAGKEIRSEPYVHWWTFMGYYVAIGECALSNVVGIRYKLAKNRKLEKHERKFMLDNPQYFKDGTMTTEQKELDQYVRNLWNNGGK